MALTLRGAADTHIGLVRRRNEDSFLLGQHLAAVADGLGGHVAGDIASSTVIDILSRHDHAIADTELATALGSALYAANQQLKHRVEAEPGLAGMGTTLVAMLWSETTAVLANVGDSRVYLLPAGPGPRRIIRLTEDHTYGNLLADADGVPNLPERITRFIDGRADGRSPDLTIRQLKTRDRYLLCSDGLSSFVPLPDIELALITSASPKEAVDRLIKLALANGGPDNITVVILDVVPEPSTPTIHVN